MALDRDIHAKGLTRLEKALVAELDGRGAVRLQDLGRRDPKQAIWGNALQPWAHELEGVFSFHEGAKDALQAAEINAFSEASTAPGTVVL